MRLKMQSRILKKKDYSCRENQGNSPELKIPAYQQSSGLRAGSRKALGCKVTAKSASSLLARRWRGGHGYLILVRVWLGLFGKAGNHKQNRKAGVPEITGIEGNEG